MQEEAEHSLEPSLHLEMQTSSFSSHSLSSQGMTQNLPPCSGFWGRTSRGTPQAAAGEDGAAATDDGRQGGQREEGCEDGGLLRERVMGEAGLIGWAGECN